jgi:hypothetical protein
LSLYSVKDGEYETTLEPRRLRFRTCQLNGTPRVQSWARIVGYKTSEYLRRKRGGYLGRRGGGGIKVRVRLRVNIKVRLRLRVRINA